MDAEDTPVGELDKLLINATRLSIGEVFREVRALGGVPVPAHVDKSAYSVISSLGMIPPELEARTVEISPQGIQRGFVLPEREKYRVITDSDAHALEIMSMHSPCTMELSECSVGAVLDYLRRGVG